MTIFNLLLLVLVLVFSTESMAALGDDSSQTYDELLLVLQWPTSFCNTHYCDHPIPKSFTVHGLWLNKNSECVNCPPTSDTSNELSQQISADLQQKMQTYWPNLVNQKNPEAFWVYEYEKHGSCVTEFQNPNQELYFQTAIDIALSIGDVMTMSLSLGQPFQEGQSYEVTDFDSVTIAGKTFYPSLRCSKVKGRQYPQLLEIVFCTDRQKKPKICTSKDKDRMVCNGQFEFPQPANSPSPSPSSFPPEMGSSAPYPEDMTDCSDQSEAPPPSSAITHFLSQIFLHVLLELFNFFLIYFI